ncbi:hypothetical protein [Nocardia jiangsuensis]|uniref:Uncharacterized protein n=1 Tax=Nocardia jiangsuensis TaxID=1691563 RepID=A0ABV8DZR4_9NOCA
MIGDPGSAPGPVIPPASEARIPVRIERTPPPALAPLRHREPMSMTFGFRRVDRNGRLNARGVVRVLGWGPDVVLEMDCAGEQVLVVRAAEEGSRPGHPGSLHVPVRLRRRLGIEADDQVLPMADPGAGVLMLSPARLVGELVSARIAEAGRG